MNQAYGMPIITPTFQSKYPANAVDDLTAQQLIADTRRRNAFYESHGFALNGNAIISFNTVSDSALSAAGNLPNPPDADPVEPNPSPADPGGLSPGKLN